MESLPQPVCTTLDAHAWIPAAVMLEAVQIANFHGCMKNAIFGKPLNLLNSNPEDGVSYRVNWCCTAKPQQSTELGHADCHHISNCFTRITKWHCERNKEYLGNGKLKYITHLRCSELPESPNSPGSFRY